MSLNQQLSQQIRRLNSSLKTNLPKKKKKMKTKMRSVNSKKANQAITIVIGLQVGRKKAMKRTTIFLINKNG